MIPRPAASRVPPASARLPALLVMLAAAVVPLYLSMFRFSLGGVLVRLADLMALALIAATLWTQPAVLRTLRRPAVLLMGTLVLYILLEGLLMNRLRVSLKEAVQLGFVVVAVTTVGWHAEQDPARFLRCFLIVSLLALVHTVAVHLAAGIYVRYKFAGDARYIFGVASAALLLAWRQQGWRGPWGWLFLLSLAPLIASLERKGALGVALVAAALLLVVSLRTLRVGPLLALLMAGLLVAAAFTFEHEGLVEAMRVAERNNYFVDQSEALWDSNTHRTALLLNGLDIIAKQPWFGSGADSLREQMGVYFSDPRLSNSTHNFFLDNLIKYGLVGGGMFFTAIGLGMARVLRLSDEPLAAGLISLYVLFAVFFISDGQAVTVMALLPTFLGFMFNRQPVQAMPQAASAWPAARAGRSASVSLSSSGAMQ